MSLQPHELLKARKKILVCPLDWGLGHATRCIPIIRQLLNLECEVVIGAYGNSLLLLKHEFPLLSFIEIPGFQVQYSSTSNQNLKLLLQLPSFIRSLIQEHHLLKKIIYENKIDAVISDNRYGLFNKAVPSVLITHQLFPKTSLPFISDFIIEKLLRNFEQVWVPDFEKEQNLSGDLSHKNKLEDVAFIGTLSRFKHEPEQEQKVYEVAAIISGPEPQRTIFFEKALKQLLQLNKKSIIVAGLPGQEERMENGMVTIINHLKTQELQKVLNQSNHIISRAGYSSIMDFAAMGRKAILVPTPGQSEQEYLAKYLDEKKWFYKQSQNDLNIKRAIENYQAYKVPQPENSVLKKLLTNWLEKV